MKSIKIVLFSFLLTVSHLAYAGLPQQDPAVSYLRNLFMGFFANVPKGADLALGKTWNCTYFSGMKDEMDVKEAPIFKFTASANGFVNGGTFLKDYNFIDFDSETLSSTHNLDTWGTSEDAEYHYVNRAYVRLTTDGDLIAEVTMTAGRATVYRKPIMDKTVEALAPSLFALADQAKNPFSPLRPTRHIRAAYYIYCPVSKISSF